MPSLKQLNEAVLAYMQEHPDDLVTVVVDATFGHRIDPREVAEFDAAVENNELVSPPAGAIGRGDAFVLTIANKANAIILSNDSFQEFHGDYPWLFDGDRLLGGKPVPHVGWVFVARAPVRGPVSRRAVRDKDHAKAAVSSRTHGRPSKAALEPMPVPKSPPPGARRRKKADPDAAAPTAAAPRAAAPAAGGSRGGADPAPSTQAPTGIRHTPINELLPFLGFVEHHPVGTMVEATTESYSSHGAYVTVGDVRAYVPLRYLADPAPRSARDVLALGEISRVRGRELQPAAAGDRPGQARAAAGRARAVGGAGRARGGGRRARGRRAGRCRAPARGGAGEEGGQAGPEVGQGPGGDARGGVAPVEVASVELAPVEPAPVVEVVVVAPVVVEPTAATPVKKAAKRARKSAKAPAPPEPAPVATPEPEPVAPEPVAPAPAKKAAKRARKSTPAPPPAPVVEAPPEPPAKKAAKRPRKAAPGPASAAAAEPTPADEEGDEAHQEVGGIDDRDRVTRCASPPGTSTR